MDSTTDEDVEINIPNEEDVNEETPLLLPPSPGPPSYMDTDYLVDEELPSYQQVSIERGDYASEGPDYSSICFFMVLLLMFGFSFLPLFFGDE